MPASLNLTIIERIQRFMFFNDRGCWEFKGRLNTQGYGHIKYQQRDQLVHRIAYRIMKGPIPQGLFVCHHCDNPVCFNPDHLFIGTQQDNIDDMIAKGRDNFTGNRRMSLYNAHTTDDPNTLRVTKFEDGNPEASYLTSDQACECPAGVRPSCRHRAMLPNLRPIADTSWFWDYDRHDIVDLNGMTKATHDRMTLREAAASAVLREPSASIEPNLRTRR